MTASSYTTYHTIDDALKQYYARRGYLHYCDNKDSGLFSNYIIEQKLDEKLTIEELNNAYDPNKYSYLWLYFDINFPIPRCATTLTHDQQQTLKFYIVQYCYKFNKSPSDEYITRVLLPKCNISRSAVIVVNSGKFDKHRTEQESIQGVCVDEIVDEVLQEYAPTNDNVSSYKEIVHKVPLSSWTRQAFFALHLFKEQMFLMSEHLEQIVAQCLKINRHECCINNAKYKHQHGYLYGISDMEIKLNLFVNKWNNNHNKKRKLKLEQLKIVLVTIHTSCRLDFIHLLNNFNISACAAMQLWIIVNDILNDNSITYASSDENWPPSLCSGFNQHDISDDDDDDGDDSGINEDDIYDEAGDNTQYIHN
eukprot:508188_1